MSFKLPDRLVYEIQQRWEQLAIREWVNQNPKIIFGVTCASILILLIAFLALLTPGEKTKRFADHKPAWFYDLNTGQFFWAPRDSVPPIEAPSGPLPNGAHAGVKAYVFTYSNDPNESELFVGFLETTDPNAPKEAPGTTRQWGRGNLIRRPTDQQWIPGNSSEGRAILREIYLPNARGQGPIYYLPE